MKKLLALMSVAILAFALTGCGAEVADDMNADDAAPAVMDDSAPAMDDAAPAAMDDSAPVVDAAVDAAVDGSVAQ